MSMPAIHAKLAAQFTSLMLEKTLVSSIIVRCTALAAHSKANVIAAIHEDLSVAQFILDL